jgi:hypothetical protein
MFKSSLWLTGTLALVVGCADVDPSGEVENGTVNVAADAPLAVIQLSEGRRLEFYATGNDVMVAERYRVGEGALLSEADKQLSAPELYRKYAAPESAIPDSLYGKAEPFTGDPAELARTTVDTNAAGGGQRAPLAPAGDVERVTAALSQGEGCNPTQSNVVFADCRTNWFGGYWAFAVATWFFDYRVQALQGSLDAVVTSKYGGGTFFNRVHLNQGQISNLHFPKARVCETFLGVNVDCYNVKSQRRLDVTNASTTTFNVDVVFFN